MRFPDASRPSCESAERLERELMQKYCVVSTQSSLSIKSVTRYSLAMMHHYHGIVQYRSLIDRTRDTYAFSETTIETKRDQKRKLREKIKNETLAQFSFRVSINLITRMPGVCSNRIAKRSNRVLISNLATAFRIAQH